MLHLISPSPIELGWPLGLAAPNRNSGAAAPMVAARDIGDSGEPGGEGVGMVSRRTTAAIVGSETDQHGSSTAAWVGRRKAATVGWTLG
jgi:hypothetical protein